MSRVDVGALLAGRFRIEGPAARGGVGSVYRARDEQTGALTAIKLLNPRDSEDGAERFEREARLLSQLDHPTIVRYVAHGHADGSPFLAMEWLDGESLSERLSRQALDVEETLVLARRVAEALGFAHEKGLVHRDVKPGNLFLVGGKVEETKLIDFGIARLLADADLTTIGLAIGTVGYMAPEQARGERNIDARADVFSLGCVLFKCVTGHAPFAGSNLTAVLAKTLFEDAPRLSEMKPGVSHALELLVARMLAKDSGQRPADGGAVSRAIVELADARRSGAPPAGALTAGEQVLVSVVLVDPGARPTAKDVEELRVSAAHFGARLDLLANGHVILTLSGTRDATDQAAQAARCALALRALMPGPRVVLATGRGVLSARFPVGQAIERAVARLEATTSARRAPAAQPAPSEMLVALDDVTAGLLDTRFVVVAREDGLYLQGERDAHDVARLLLGKPAPFVGRARELGILQAILDACRDEKTAQVVLVTGAAGVGKSRLRHEFVRRLRGASIPGSVPPPASNAPTSQPLEVWIGRGDPMSRGSPLRMLSQALRRAIGLVDGEPLTGSRRKIRTRVLRHAAPGEHASRVTEFLGELVGVPFPEEDSVQLRAARHDPVLRGDQMRRAFEDFAAAECAAQPVLLVLEDLHWGDQPTVDLVEALLRRLREAPLLVLAVARPEVEEIFPSLWSRATVTRLPLAELSERASASLVRATLGDSVTDDTIERITVRAEGNAFFLEELIRAVAERDESLPETVVAMVQARLERLSPDERRALRAASVFGVVFWAGGVAELVGDQVAARLGPAFDALLALELVTRRQEARFKGEVEYVFRHDHVREAAYAMLTDSDRALGHRLAGDWLERAGERDALVLAEHFERGGEGDRAVSAYMRAAEQALAANDLGAALARATRALAGAKGAHVIGELRLLQAEVHAWRGEYSDARERGDEAMRALVRGSSSWHEAAGQVAEVCGRLGDDERLVAIGNDLLELALGAGGDGRQAIAAVRAAAQLFWSGRFDLAHALIRAVEPSHEKLVKDEPAAAAWIDYARSLRALFDGDLGENLRLKEAAVSGFDRAGDERNACIQRVRLGYGSLLIGAHAEGEGVLRDALAAAERMGLSKVSALAKHNLGHALARMGRLAEGRAVELQALRELEAQKDRRLAGASHLYLALMVAAAGDVVEGERHAREAVEMQRTKPPSYAEALAALAAVLLAAGRAAEALKEAKEASALLDQLGAVEDAEALIRLVHAEALHAVGDVAGARAAITRASARLLERSEKIRDLELRRCFLEDEPDNARTMQRAREWCADVRPATLPS
jgi:hypothetical protein